MAEIYNNLSIVKENTGDLAGAGNYLRQCIDTTAKLVDARPDEAKYRRDLAVSYSNLSILLQQTIDLPGAIQFARKSIEIADKLVADHPNDGDLRLLAGSHGTLGNALYAAGDPAGAVASHRNAIAIRDPPGFGSSQRAGLHQHRLAINFNNLGQRGKRCGTYVGAADTYRQGIEVRHKLTADYPDVPDYWRGLANKSANLGNVLFEMGETAAAEESLATRSRVLDQAGFRPPRCYRLSGGVGPMLQKPSEHSGQVRPSRGGAIGSAVR